MDEATVARIHEALDPAGVIRTCDLRRILTRTQLTQALRSRVVTRLRRGVYRLGGPADRVITRPWSDWTRTPPDESEIRAINHDIATARACGGVLGGWSAARAHGWMLPVQPARITVVVPPDSRPPASRDRRVSLQWRRLDPQERSDLVTSPLVTAIHCAAASSFPRALAVLDSALRSGTVGAEELVREAARYSGRGAAVLRRAAALADARSANPFESLVRAATTTVPGLHCIPQYRIDLTSGPARVDLCDPGLRIVVECDSYEFHMGSPARWRRDVDRYNALTAAGWSVVRVTWEQVTRRPEELRALLVHMVSAAVQRQGLSAPDPHRPGTRRVRTPVRSASPARAASPARSASSTRAASPTRSATTAGPPRQGLEIYETRETREKLRVTEPRPVPDRRWRADAGGDSTGRHITRSPALEPPDDTNRRSRSRSVHRRRSDQ